ncbi:hypothetical protein AMJ57_01440 [Parcubacteria bacterium SG8_24]|nr:MAG: hypothetical protein AMJ57_01440 [Parcubacteria bacterium SG8_24]
MAETAGKRVAVVIVTYDAERYLDDCLGSLRLADTSGIDLTVFAVDNDSHDGTARIIGERYPEVRLIRNDRNIGFAAGNNRGIEAATAAGAEYVYLLNQDTEVAAPFLREALQVMESDDRIGSVQSLLLLSPERHLVNSSGNAIHFLGFGFCEDYRRPVERLDRSRIRPITYASGAGVLFRVSVLRETGLFDERLFLYHEDLDLGWRLRLAGFENVLAPHSVVYHKYEFSRSIGKYYYMERNRYIVLLKNLRLWSLLVLLPALLIAEVGLWIGALRGGWWRKKRAATAYFLKGDAWRHILTGRRRVARTRRISDRRLVRHFSSVIAHQEVEKPLVRYVANPLMTVAWAVMRLLII